MTLQPAEIRSHLVRRSITTVDLSKQADSARPMVSDVIHGRRATPRIRRAIAEVIGFTYLEVWGEEDPGTDKLRPGRKPGTTVTLCNGERESISAPHVGKDASSRSSRATSAA